MVKDTTLYKILEVEPDANEATIKKAYIKLSKTWHPDKHADDMKEEATKKFKEITEAKEILTNKEKRDLYDQIGMDILKQGAQGQEGPDFGNMFGGMGGFPFGGMPGGFPFGGMHQQNSGPENINETMNVTLEQIYNEESVNFTYKQKVLCSKCDGEGSKNGKPTTCNGCNGKGMRVQVVRMGPMIQQAVSPCQQCNGKGKMIEDSNKCDVCNAKCYTMKDKTIQVPLKAGLSNGNKINLQGRGHMLKNGKTDLIIQINEVPHKIFKRHENDLFVDMDLKLYQALFGFDKIINHLDGRKLHISCSSKTDVNMIRKISGEGMISLNGSKGDMYIKFNMTLPNFNNLPQDTKTQIKNALQIMDKNEVTNETQVKTTSNLVKTIMNDCKAEQTENILNLLMQLNQPERHNNSDEDNNNGQPQCVQQ
jgi:DnaJ family protein A protein 2